VKEGCSWQEPKPVGNNENAYPSLHDKHSVDRGPLQVKQELWQAEHEEIVPSK